MWFVVHLVIAACAFGRIGLILGRRMLMSVENFGLWAISQMKLPQLPLEPHMRTL